MPVLFSGNAGVVVALQEPAMQCNAVFAMQDPQITFSEQRSIITSLSMSHKVNLQFLHTLGSFVYIYVFGDRMGQVTLQGLSFCTCDNRGLHGAGEMLTWYMKYKASRRPDPIRLTMGENVIEGFVTDLTESVVDPSINLVQWSLVMATLPEL